MNDPTPAPNDAAGERLARRRASVPPLRYPEQLPVVERREELLAAIREHQVVIVAGETGSGKSTQLPKLCLELGRGVEGLVGHTQPRRLAARAVAERVAEELGTEVGDLVGYAVRFNDRVSDRTLVKVMTDGILLNEIQRDRELRAYDTILIDEAHERSLNIDFLLGYLTQLLPRRPDLKLVVTSATIDTARFARHFDAPVVEVSGRTYPVELRYRPLGDDRDDDRDVVQAICDAVVELQREGPGDVLVFLSGEREIRDTAEAIERLGLPDTEVLPLFARLSLAEQHRVFAPHRGRRVVLATNVAETSLTVPGIRYVVDPGTARISRFNRRTKVQRLPIEPISQASADQRAGRCGRVAPGICIRLYGEDDYLARREFTEPEILRTNLASVLLQMAALDLGDIGAFPFVDPPDSRAVTDGLLLLHELGALASDRRDARPRLTPLGRRLARLPVDPRLGRMVLEADRHGCVAEVLVIAAALAIQDPRERPRDKEQQAAQAHARFAHPDSDLLAYVSLWRYLREAQRERSSSQFRKLCRTEYLNVLRVREWQDVHAQLRLIARQLGIRAADAEASDDAVHQALLAGLLSHVGAWDPERQEYEGTRGTRFVLGGGSSLARRRPRWVMAAELVETDRLRARTVARIQPEWIERAAGPLLTRSHGEPWWDERRAQALCDERVSLFGLQIAGPRRVPYSRVDAAEARRLFVEHALVRGEWEAEWPFQARADAAADEVRRLEAKARRDLLVTDDELARAYDARVGPDVTSGRTFERWWRRASIEQPALLDLSVDELLDPDAAPVAAEEFPDTWVVDGVELALSYRFEPGHPLDGVTVDVPLDVLLRLDLSPLEWQVPGNRREVVATLLRALPKAVRRRYVPVPEFVDAVLARTGPADGSLVPAVERALARLAGEALPRGAVDGAALPEHLRMTYRAVDESGRAVAWSRDLPALRARLADRARASVARAATEWERTGLTSWVLDALPRSIDVRRDGRTIEAYPSLVDEGSTVGVRVLTSRSEQGVEMWLGTLRLLEVSTAAAVRAAAKRLPNRVALALAGAPLSPPRTVGAVVEDCARATLADLLRGAGGPAWDAEAWRALESSVSRALPGALAGTVEAVGEVLAVVRRAADGLDAATAPVQAPSVADERAHLARLLAPGFVEATGVDRLDDLLRYARAAERRVQRLLEDPLRDRRLLPPIQALEAIYDERRAGDATGEVRWLLEELRVSTFAQSLGTKGAISEQRVRKALAGLQH